MNLRTATTDQLRKERLRLTNMQQMIQHRRDSSAVNRGGREAGFRRAATTHQQDRELIRINAQIAQLDAELAFRAARDEATQSAASTTDESITTADGEQSPTR